MFRLKRICMDAWSWRDSYNMASIPLKYKRSLNTDYDLYWSERFEKATLMQLNQSSLCFETLLCNIPYKCRQEFQT